MWAACAVAGCGDDDGLGDAGGDAMAEDAGVDSGPAVPVSTAHCTYETPPSNANASGAVEAGSLEAGAAEGIIDVPMGAALGAYTARVDFLGDIDPPDRRFNELSGSFAPSIGIETRPMAKAVALRAGGETIVLLKTDLSLADEALLHDIEMRLMEDHGHDLSGKVLFATSHSHSAWAQYTANSVLWVGLGRIRTEIVEAVVRDLAAVAAEAIDNLEPAQIGIGHDPDFDPDDQVTRDRRSENDALAGGPSKDRDLFVVRVDTMDGAPIAIVPIFGIHGTVTGADNLLASSDAIGAIELAIEESFDSPVVVMHMQGAGGDVSPAGTGGVRCDGQPCYPFARAEMVGLLARDMVLTTWSDAGDALTDTLAMQMVTRHIELGPNWENFDSRGGTLRYAPWDGTTVADGDIFSGDTLLSPIDEFNAPHGAALCGEDNNALFPRSQLPGTDRRDNPYRSCADIEAAAPILGRLMVLPFEPMPACATTRTTISALRIGDHLMMTVPGEPVTLYADRLRAGSPVDPAHTIVVGFAQDHVGYVMTAEDWLQRGYEPSINVWGPLEGELIGERTLDLAPLAMAAERADGTEGHATRYDRLPIDDTDVPEPDAAPMAGTVEDVPWERQYVRGGVPLESGQPRATVPRLESAVFAWIGEDPRSATPAVSLEREVSEGVFEPVRRRSGRLMADRDLLVTHTPDPLVRTDPTTPRTHRFAVEWQAVVAGSGPSDPLEDRVGVALGRYRFRVQGAGYDLESAPFEVVPATLIVDARIEGGRLVGSASLHAPTGFRLLHATLLSNEPIPANGEVVLAIEGGAEIEERTVTLDADGNFDTEAPAVATRVTVTDRFGNTGALTL